MWWTTLYILVIGWFAFAYAARDDDGTLHLGQAFAGLIFTLAIASGLLWLIF